MHTSCSPVFAGVNKLSSSWVNLCALHIFDFELEEEPYYTKLNLFEPEYTDEELRERKAMKARQAAI